MVGNGKTHHTPTPEGLRKIKIISFEVFLKLKELLKVFKERNAIFLSHNAPRIKDLNSTIHPARSIASKKSLLKNNNAAQTCSYEPTQIGYAYNSSFWQWQRVSEWFKYINDPSENINGHIIT